MRAAVSSCWPANGSTESGGESMAEINSPPAPLPISLSELHAEAGSARLCGLAKCWCRVPHWHPFLPSRARLDMVLTCDGAMVRPTA